MAEQLVTEPLIRYHGAKFRMAEWIISKIPNHTCYTEVFGGSAGILLQKPRAYAEVYNDLDGEIVNLFRVMRDRGQREQLIEQLLLTPYSREEFEQAYMDSVDPVERARRTVIWAQMGFGSAGASKGKTGFRIDTKRKYGTAQHLWSEYPEKLETIGMRLRGVLIENRPAVEVLLAHDDVETLHYVDPPYVHETRYEGAKSGRIYRHEMSDQDHKDLLKVLMGLKGKVMLSGYPNDIYSETLKDWQYFETSSRISAGRGTGVKTEGLWLNAAAAEPDLFEGLKK